MTLIAALAANRVIGDRGGIPWHLPPDLAHFKRVTMGHWLLMGRRTWDAIGHRALPGRTTIVVSRDPGFTAPGAHVVRSIDEGFRRAAEGGAAELFVCGGEEIYRQTLGRADRLCLTLLDRYFPGDTRFPEVDPAEWRAVAEERHPPAGEPPTAYSFVECERVRPAGARRTPLGAALALFLAVFSCGPGAGPAPALAAWERTGKVRIYLVQLHDGGVNGARIGCGDSLVPVEVELPGERPALRGALEALLAIKSPYDPRSGLYTALHASPLEIRRLQHEAGTVRIDFAGWVEIEEECDAPRVLEQLTRTATQFRDVERVEVFVDGAPLDRALTARGGLGGGRTSP